MLFARTITRTSASACRLLVIMTFVTLFGFLLYLLFSIFEIKIIEIKVDFMYGSVKGNGKLLVVESGNRALMGRYWINKLDLKISGLNNVKKGVEL